MIKLYSARACPYALRTRLALQEKGLAYEHIEIDLRDKPAYFASLSRYGKVPALFDDGRHIYESAVINEYLDDQYPEPSLMPARAIDRAYARIWIDFANTRMMPASAQVRYAKTEQAKQAAREEFAGYCAILGEELGDRRWFLGDHFTLVDVTYAPFFARLSRYEGITIPDNVVAWWTRISERPAYIATGGLGPARS